MSPSDNLVQINGFWIDLTIVESTLIVALSSYSLISVKLVATSPNSRIALFFTSLSQVNELAFLKAARDTLLTCPSFPEPLAATISLAKQLTEMPLDRNGDIDAAALRSIAEELQGARHSFRRSRPALSVDLGPASASLLSPRSSRLLGTARAIPLSRSPMSVVRSSTFPSMNVPTIAIHSPGLTPTPAVEGFSARFATTPAYPPPVQPSSIQGITLRSGIALEIASYLTTLLSLPASSSVPTHLPLRLTGLDSLATAQLYFWLQERYEYDGDIANLFEDDASAEVIASHIAGMLHYLPLYLAFKLISSVVQVIPLFLPLRRTSLLLPQGPSTRLSPRSSSSPFRRVSVPLASRPVSPTSPGAGPRFTPSIPTPSATSSSPG